MTVNISWRCFFCVCLVLVASKTVLADTSGNKPFGKGKSYAGLQVGYGNGFRIGNTSSGDGRNVEYLAAFPSYGYGISDILGEDAWYQGNVDIVGETEFFASFEPRTGSSAGVAVLLRYNFQFDKRIVPFIDAGVGVGYLDFDLRDQSDGLIFYPQAGFGVHYFLSDRLAMNVSYRLHHMSNAGSEQPNNGINANLGLFGFIYRFD